MPFDGAGTTPAIRRAMLAERLRNDTEWEWNFCDTAGCAVGMINTMFNGQFTNICDFFGLTDGQYYSIFGYINSWKNELEGRNADWCNFYQKERSQVTPAMVADALERIK